MTQHIVRILNIHAFTERISQIIVQADHHFTYQPGQYIAVLHAPFHSYLSIANAPNTTHQLEFHLSHAAKNNEALHLLEVSQSQKYWQIEGPFGDKTVLALQQKPIIFLAHGTGFAPTKAMIEALMLDQPFPIYFYWSAFRETDFYLKQQLQAWKNQSPDFYVELIAANPVENIVQLILKKHANIADYQLYVSGAPRFVQTAYQFFLQQNLPPQQFFSDYT